MLVGYDAEEEERREREREVLDPLCSYANPPCSYALPDTDVDYCERLSCYARDRLCAVRR